MGTMPAKTAAGGYAVTTGLVTVDVLAHLEIGFAGGAMGGIIALAVYVPRSKWEASRKIVVSTVSGGCFLPLVERYMDAPDLYTRFGVAAVIGVFSWVFIREIQERAPKAMDAVLKWFNRKLEK